MNQYDLIKGTAQDEKEATNLQYLILKKAKTFTFSGTGVDEVARIARQFQAKMLLSAINRVGCDINMRLPNQALDELLQRGGAKIENRQFYSGTDSWRNGFYVFRNDEVAFFISSVVPFNSGKGKYSAMVCTNVPDDETKQFFMANAPGMNTTREARILC